MIRPFPAMLVAATLVMAQAAPGLAAEPVTPSHRVYLIGALLLSHPHFRLDDGADGPVAFIDIQNRGAAPDRLIGATVDGATETVMVGGDAETALTLPPHTTVTMARDGVHLVTHGWTNPGQADGRLGATLHFERVGDIRVSLRHETDADPEPPPPAVTAERTIDLSR